MADRFVLCLILLTAVNTEKYDFQNKPLLGYFKNRNCSDLTIKDSSLNVTSTTILLGNELKNTDGNKNEEIVNKILNIEITSNDNRNDTKRSENIQEISEDTGTVTDYLSKYSNFMDNQQLSALHNSQENTRSIKEIDTEKIANKFEETTNNLLNKESIMPNDHNHKNINTTHEVFYKEDINTASSQIYTSYSKPTYQVHENVIDIPDDRRPAGPIITNYTKRPHLNTITPTEKSAVRSTTSSRRNHGNNEEDELDFQIDNDETKNVRNNVKCKNKVNCVFKGIKNYFSGLHKEFVNGFHSILRSKF